MNCPICGMSEWIELCNSAMKRAINVNYDHLKDVNELRLRSRERERVKKTHEI